MRMTLQQLVKYVGHHKGRAALRVGSDVHHIYYRDDVEIDLDKLARDSDAQMNDNTIMQLRYILSDQNDEVEMEDDD